MTTFRTLSMILVLGSMSLTLPGCRGAQSVPPAGPGMLSDNVPAAPVSGVDTEYPVTPPASPSSPWTGGSETPVTLTSTDSGGGADPGPSSFTPNPPGTTTARVDVRSGGKSMERQAYAWAAGAVQPRTNDPTVLRHEAVHWIDSELSRNASWQDLNTKTSRAFYIWGTNQYYVVRHTGIAKRDVLHLVPTHLTTSHDNYFSNFDFASRDALHLLEDYCAELGSGEKSHLLFDMLVFCAATVLKLEQLQASGRSEYWSGDAGAVYRGTYKLFTEKAAPGLQGYLRSFAADTSAKGTALRSFLERTYGAAWTKQVLGFSPVAGSS